MSQYLMINLFDYKYFFLVYISTGSVSLENPNTIRDKVGLRPLGNEEITFEMIPSGNGWKFEY